MYMYKYIIFIHLTDVSVLYTWYLYPKQLFAVAFMTWGW